MKRTLWIAQSGSVQAYYRCALPANELDQDWVGYTAGPPGVGYMTTGNVHGPPNIEDYEIIIVQLVSGSDWIKFIKDCQSSGKTVLYECDDYLHGVHRIKDHRYRGAYSPKRVKKYVEAMKACDGLICSTEFLAEEYSKYNSNVFVYKNSISTFLYDVEKHPEKDSVVIGWSGGTGHLQAIKSWFAPLIDNLSLFDQAKFISVGSGYANDVNSLLPDKGVTIPWTPIENYPFILGGFDIAIAPSHNSKYFRSKSDLRWLEASAAGIPCLVNPITYPEVEDGVTGLVATTQEEFSNKLEELILDSELRTEIGNNAREYVRNNRDIKVGVKQWGSILS